MRHILAAVAFSALALVLILAAIIVGAVIFGMAWLILAVMGLA